MAAKPTIRSLWTAPLNLTFHSTRGSVPGRTEKAKLILKYAKEAKGAFAQQCQASRLKRRKSGGALTHAEQDLLRAMLVFAGAGLDACLKQLIRDSLPLLVMIDLAVQAELETFVLRRLRDEEDPETAVFGASGRRFLAKVLSARQPSQRIVEEFIGDLTGESLQSAEQLFRVTKALGVPMETIGLGGHELKSIFKARNEIIHEMDILLVPKKDQAHKRRSRATDDMTRMAGSLLTAGEKIVLAVERKLIATG